MLGHLFSFFSIVNLPTFLAQTISTSIPVPPIQWLNLTPSLTGPSAPALKDASMGYDEGTRTLIIFGGESDGGFVQSKTYLLNLENLVWTSPSPPANLQAAPSPRSAALSGLDFAASNRHGFVVVGGKGQNGALSDVWEFDFINQFWSKIALSPGGPSPRWGASGGIDFRTNPIQDRVVPGPNNTFYLVGGSDGTNSFPEAWRLNISGTLSSNLPNGVQGSWERISVNNLPSPSSPTGTVISQNVISIGGCSENTGSVPCSSASSFVVDLATHSFISPSSCPVPRKGATLVPNTNQFSTSFSSQVFLLLGISNTTLWNDEGGLSHGEVAVLDTQTGTWGRVIPSGNPDASGKVTFPTPREGSAAFSWTSGLVGRSRSAYTDTLLYGGRDADGKYLSELWLLRTYEDSITHSGQSWAGFGAGRLQSGVDANGQGVSLQYMTQCAMFLNSTTQTTSSPAIPPPPIFPVPVDASFAHKLLAPLSVSIILFALLLYRDASPSVSSPVEHAFKLPSLYLCGFLLVIAYGIGIGGIATSFVSTRLADGSETGKLRTTHGKVGLALFVCFYGVLPFLVLLSRRGSHNGTLPKFYRKNMETRQRIASNATEEKPVRCAATEVQSVHSSTPRSPSFPTYTSWPQSVEGQISEENQLENSPGPSQSFEVTNRPSNPRHITTNRPTSAAYDSDNRIPRAVKNLSEVNWLERRRTLNAVGELDYALTQAQRALEASTPATVDLLLNGEPAHDHSITLPNLSAIFLRGLHHAALLAICVFTAYALWTRAPRFAFALFTSWTVLFYILLFGLAWHGKPRDSVAAILFIRLRSDPRHSVDRPQSTSQPLQEGFPFPTSHSGPYTHHQPNFRLATSMGHEEPNNQSLSVEGGEIEEGENEDARQQMSLEEEMGRRDVSIITVPKRRLRIANPT